MCFSSCAFISLHMHAHMKGSLILIIKNKYIKIRNYYFYIQIILFFHKLLSSKTYKVLLLQELQQELLPRPLIKSPAQVFLIHQSFNHQLVAAAARPSLPTRTHQILQSGQKRSSHSSGNTRSIVQRSF